MKSDSVEFEYELMKSNRENNSRLIPFIKMSKVWKNLQNIEDNLMTSLGIEQITRDIFDKNNPIGSYPKALVDWFNSIKNRSRNKRTLWATIGGLVINGLKGGIWGIAVGFVYDLFNKPQNWQLINNSHSLAKEAEKDLKNENYRGASDKYRILFGNDFPKYQV